MTREMKNSGVQWIGDIPKDWEVRRLRTLGAFSASGIDKNIVEGEPLVHIINYVDVYNNKKFILGKKDYMIVSAPRAKVIEHQVRVGDMIFTPSSETKEDIGVSAVIIENLPNTAYSYHVLRFRFFNEDEVNINYRKYLCNNRYVGQYFTTRSTGTIRQTLSRLDFKDCFVILPPISEQKAIADILDAKCGEIDGLLADLDSEVKTLAEYKKSLIAETVTRGLNPNVPMKSSGIPWADTIPAHWNVHPVYSYFSERVHKNIFGNEQNLLSLSYGKIIRKDINAFGGLLPASYNTYNIVESGDIVIRPTDLQNDKRSLRTGLVTEHGIITSAYIALKPNDNIYSPYYHYLLHSYDVKKVFYNMGNGVRQGLNYGEFSRLKLIEPPLSEQKAIAEFLDTKCAAIDQAIADKTTQIETLKAYKSSLIYEYVTGKK